MPVRRLAEAIDDGVPLIVLAPHLDDAALSCGALMMHAVRHTQVTVATLFTEGGEAPYTLSARRYLRQVGAQSAQALYRQRRAEDRAALEPIGIRCVHAGLTEALFRRRHRRPERSSLPARLLPELAHMYPVYRVCITAGRIVAADAGTLNDVSDIVRRLAGAGPSVVLAPLGIGGHVDHVVVRTAAECSGARVVYYSDFPYNQRNPVETAFIQRHGLVEMRWPYLAEAKAELVRAYSTQVEALFKDRCIPRVPEVFYLTADQAGRTFRSTTAPGPRVRKK
jgi:LmbE family N-acetylglucosaminyl deacetylase